MEIETLRLDEIEDAHYNPRKLLTPDDPAWKQIEASIDEFGLVEPLVFNRATGRLVGGHQRKKILESKGVEEALFSVVEIEDEAKERALNIALNQGGSWDRDLLASVLDGIRDVDFLGVTGFDPAGIDGLLAEIERENSANFLNDLAAGGAPSDSEDGAPAVAQGEGEEQRGARYFEMGFTVTEPQRTVVQTAIGLARRLHGVNSIEALVLVSQAYIDAHAEAPE